MYLRRIGLTALFLGVLFVVGCGGSSEQAETRPFVPGGGGETSGQADVTYTVPEGWVEEQPASSFRKAQFRLPRAEGDPDDAELAVFYFGPGQGGTVQANIERWIGQFSAPGGGSARESAKTTERDVNGRQVTILDVSGIYTAGGMGPMSPPGQPKPNYRALAAIIDTPSGPWFFKLTGPQRTVEKWEASFYEFVDSLRVQ